MNLREGFKYKCVAGRSDFTVGKVYMCIRNSLGDLVIISDKGIEYDDWGLDMWDIELKDIEGVDKNGFR